MRHNELAALRVVVSAFEDAAKYHCLETHESERANSQRATAMLNKCCAAMGYMRDENYDWAIELANDVTAELNAARAVTLLRSACNCDACKHGDGH